MFTALLTALALTLTPSAGRYATPSTTGQHIRPCLLTQTCHPKYKPSFGPRYVWHGYGFEQPS